MTFLGIIDRYIPCRSDQSATRIVTSPSGRLTPIAHSQTSDTSPSSGTSVSGDEVTLTSNAYGAANEILHSKSSIHYTSPWLQGHSWSTSSDFTYAPGLESLIANTSVDNSSSYALNIRRSSPGLIFLHSVLGQALPADFRAHRYVLTRCLRLESN